MNALSTTQALLDDYAQPRVFHTSKGERVESTLTDLEAAQAIMRAEATGRVRTGSFATQLAERVLFGSGVTANQRPWLHKLALETQAPPPPPPAPVAGLDLTPLVQMMQRAAEKLRHPKVAVTFPAVNGAPERALQLSVAGPRSRCPGSLNVTDGGPFGENQWFGRVNTAGAFEPSRSCPEDVASALALWAVDPTGIAKAHGRRTGHCCFCRRALETDESLEAGYGPVCADKYGLPWGGKGAAV